MCFFRRLFGVFRRRPSGGNPTAQERTVLEGLRKKVTFWEHQALLYEMAGLPRGALRCQSIAHRYRARLLCLTFPSEDD